MKESNPRNRHVNALSDKFELHKASVYETRAGLKEAKKRFKDTNPSQESAQAASDVVGRYMRGMEQETDTSWLQAMEGIPEVTNEMILTIWEAKEQYVNGIRKTAARTDVPSQIQPPSPDNDAEDALAKLFTSSTPSQEIDARRGDLIGLFNVATEDYEDARGVIEDEALDALALDGIDRAIVAKNSLAEYQTDGIWIQILEAHPYISDTTIVELIDNKHSERAQYNDDFETISEPEDE